MVVHASGCRVYVNDVDISSMVRAVEIRAAADRIVETTLVLYARPTITNDSDGMTMRFQVDQPQSIAVGVRLDASQTQTSPRGIALRSTTK